jgi:hypothetical protein
LYFSRNINTRTNSNRGSNVLQIFKNRLVNNEWTNTEKINFCDSLHSYCHPTLNKNGNKMYFASNIDGGFGGMDIYYSNYENSKWSKPINMGSKVNSSSNEVFPFIYGDSILYFSSDNNSGMGGLDIYSVNLNKDEDLILLEAPINSIYDDFGIFLDSTINNGYISSNRNLQTNDDIYFFYDKYPKVKNCNKFENPKYCFTFFEENDIQSIDSVELVYEWNLGDGNKILGKEASHCYSKSGNYTIDLNIIEKISGELFYNQASYEFNLEDSAQLYINTIDTAIANKAFKIDCFKSKLEGYKIIDFYWDFGDNTYSKGKFGNHFYKSSGTYKLVLSVNCFNELTNKKEVFSIYKNITVLEK